jgi:hypothetical protein
MFTMALSYKFPNPQFITPHFDGGTPHILIHISHENDLIPFLFPSSNGLGKVRENGFPWTFVTPYAMEIGQLLGVSGARTVGWHTWSVEGNRSQGNTSLSTKELP